MLFRLSTVKLLHIFSHFRNGFFIFLGGTTGTLQCVCDGKNPCEWKSDDFSGDLNEDDMCITDHTCPKKAFEIYTGELDMTRNRFINDPTFNTLQDRITGIHFKRSVKIRVIENHKFLENDLIFLLSAFRPIFTIPQKLRSLGEFRLQLWSTGRLTITGAGTMAIIWSSFGQLSCQTM